mmetsp:Transcript_13225/g.24519  ORF Transcript_13225/g.24519 Transcript_13225/m.24519 type:complete len:85 (+) Transcript_13225:209-463(+)
MISNLEQTAFVAVFLFDGRRGDTTDDHDNCTVNERIQTATDSFRRNKGHKNDRTQIDHNAIGANDPAFERDVIAKNVLKLELKD